MEVVVNTEFSYEYKDKLNKEIYIYESAIIGLDSLEVFADVLLILTLLVVLIFVAMKLYASISVNTRYEAEEYKQICLKKNLILQNNIILMKKFSVGNS